MKEILADRLSRFDRGQSITQFELTANRHSPYFWLARPKHCRGTFGAINPFIVKRDKHARTTESRLVAQSKVRRWPTLKRVDEACTADRTTLPGGFSEKSAGATSRVSLGDRQVEVRAECRCSLNSRSSDPVASSISVCGGRVLAAPFAIRQVPRRYARWAAVSCSVARSAASFPKAARRAVPRGNGRPSARG